MTFRPLLIIVICAMATQAASREIPRSEIYSTRQQEGLQYISSGRRVVDGKLVVEDYVPAMEVLSRDHNGASNVFVVDSGSIRDAIGATAEIVAPYRSVGMPMPLQTETGNNWLAVYLGSGQSSPLMYIVDHASLIGNTIRFTYRRPKSRGGTDDIVYYYYWLPIGKLDDGVYNLELFDTEANAVTLMRRVEVKRR